MTTALYKATKNDVSCRIPASKVKAYEAKGYTCTEIKPEGKTEKKAAPAKADTK